MTSFSATVGKFSKAAIVGTRGVVRAIKISLFTSVIMDTPVLSGRLRGDWQLTDDAPASEQSGRVDTSGGTTCADMRGKVKADGTKQYLANNMPYCEMVEFDGWSWQKAPEGMVRKNVARISQIVADEAKKRGESK